MKVVNRQGVGKSIRRYRHKKRDDTDTRHGGKERDINRMPSTTHADKWSQVADRRGAHPLLLMHRAN